MSGLFFKVHKNEERQLPCVCTFPSRNSKLLPPSSHLKGFFTVVLQQWTLIAVLSSICTLFFFVLFYCGYPHRHYEGQAQRRRLELL